MFMILPWCLEYQTEVTSPLVLEGQTFGKVFACPAPTTPWQRFPFTLFSHCILSSFPRELICNLAVIYKSSILCPHFLEL